MPRVLIIAFLFLSSLSAKSQEAELLVRYDFAKDADPPSKPFYLRVYINGVFADSTKPHLPHHNLANAVRVKIGKESLGIKIEGCVKEEKDGVVEIKTVMEWYDSYQVDRKKGRIALRLNSDYEVVVTTKDY